MQYCVTLYLPAIIRNPNSKIIFISVLLVILLKKKSNKCKTLGDRQDSKILVNVLNLFANAHEFICEDGKVCTFCIYTSVALRQRTNTLLFDI